MSGRGFAEDYGRHASLDLAEPVDLKPVEIIERMRGGDRLARLVWGRYVDRVARGMSLIVNILDPDIFVMGGGMSNVDELYAACPRRSRATRSRPSSTHPSCKARHGDSSGVRGAAWLWKD